MLSSHRRPSNIILIFSSAEYLRRVLLLISRTVFSAVPFGVIFHPFVHRQFTQKYHLSFYIKLVRLIKKLNILVLKDGSVLSGKYLGVSTPGTKIIFQTNYGVNTYSASDVQEINNDSGEAILSLIELGVLAKNEKKPLIKLDKAILLTTGIIILYIVYRGITDTMEFGDLSSMRL